MYWNLGKRIYEEEQQGKERADGCHPNTDSVPAKTAKTKTINVLIFMVLLDLNG